MEQSKGELKPEYQQRLETRLCTPTDSELKPSEADIILIVNTFIYIQDKAAYLRHLHSVLPEGGKLMIIDVKKKRIPLAEPRPQKRFGLYQVEDLLLQAGFQLYDSDDCSLDYQYIVTGEK